MTTVSLPRSASDIQALMRLDDDGGAPDRSAAMTEPVAGDAPGPDPLTRRQCARCRHVFDGDPTRHSAPLTEWWLCPPCRLTLLGVGPDSAGHRPEVPNGPDAS